MTQILRVALSYMAIGDRVNAARVFALRPQLPYNTQVVVIDGNYHKVSGLVGYYLCNM